IGCSVSARAQDQQVHKVVFQLTNGDSLVHKAMVRQIGHILEADANTKIEVVCHSAGLPFLIAAQSTQAAKVKELSAQGVTFFACENTMRDKKIQRSDLLPEAGTVPSGMMEIIIKQEAGWAYIKAGF
ncbi:MAG: DsrE family protein, partial [Saprospiraceae bacterium]|nr:DsrE family protein [Saprospiraceae bacterium]